MNSKQLILVLSLIIVFFGACKNSAKNEEQQIEAPQTENQDTPAVNTDAAHKR